MECKIDYVLYTDKRIELEEKNIDSFYIPNKILVFMGNEIDIKKQIYKRTTNEYEMIIDFNKKTCELKFDDTNKCKFDIESFFKYKDNEIILEYAFDEEIKKIIISVKE